MGTFTCNDPIIDSRDVIERIEELESELQDEDLDDDSREELQGELDTLRSLVNEASQSPDWEYGEALIADDYFIDYCKELAADIGAIDKNARWPVRHIDWTAAAEELQGDYFTVEFEGKTFWIRS